MDFLEEPYLPKGDASPGRNSPASLEGYLALLGLQEIEMEDALVTLSIDDNGGLRVQTPGLDRVLMTLARALVNKGAEIEELQKANTAMTDRADQLEATCEETRTSVQEFEIAISAAAPPSPAPPRQSILAERKASRAGDPRVTFSNPPPSVLESVLEIPAVPASDAPVLGGGRTTSEGSRSPKERVGRQSRMLAVPNNGGNGNGQAGIPFAMQIQATAGMASISALDELEKNIAECFSQKDEEMEQKLADIVERLEAIEEEKAFTTQTNPAAELESMNVRFVMAHDEVMGIKADLGLLQKTTKEGLLLKADQKDVSELRKVSDVLASETKQAQTALQEANKNMMKFDQCLKEVEQSKAQVQELMKLFQDECQEIRDWTTGSIADLRASTREKIQQVEDGGRVEEIRKELRDGMAKTSEAAERNTADIRRKAGVSEVAKIREDLEAVRRTLGAENQLLIGTRCLGCDRALLPGVATDQGRVDLAKTWHPQDQPPSPLGGLQDLRLTGTPRLPGAAQGRPESPSTTSASARAWGGPRMTPRGNAEMPERFPAREAPPLVRVLQKGYGPTALPRKGNLREALGARRPSQGAE